jgi:Flp pilus assembly protein TadD
LPGCAGIPPTEAEIKSEDTDSKVTQALRMAEQVRSGGDVMSASLFYGRAHLLDPSRPEPLIGLAETEIALGAYDDALNHYRKATLIAPKDAKMQQGFGNLLLKLGRADEAAVAFRAAMLEDGSDHRIYNGLGIALDLLGRSAEAQEAYQTGLRSAPGHDGLRNNLALSLALSGKRDEARLALRELAARSGAAGQRARHNLALVVALDGHVDEAVALIAGSMSQTDLDRKAAFFESIRTLSGRELAKAVFAGGPVSEAPAGQFSPARSARNATPAAAPAPAADERVHGFLTADPIDPAIPIAPINARERLHLAPVDVPAAKSAAGAVPLPLTAKAVSSAPALPTADSGRITAATVMRHQQASARPSEPAAPAAQIVLAAANIFPDEPAWSAAAPAREATPTATAKTSAADAAPAPWAIAAARPDYSPPASGDPASPETPVPAAATADAESALAPAPDLKPVAQPDADAELAMAASDLNLPAAAVTDVSTKPTAAGPRSEPGDAAQSAPPPPVRPIERMDALFVEPKS